MSKLISVFDVADYIIKKWPENRKPLTAMKLHKLIYYSQAWYLAWTKKRLFKEKIFAWCGGPVVKELYAQHRDQFYVKNIGKGSMDNLSSDHKQLVDTIIDSYGRKSAQWLSDLTHLEDPWKKARESFTSSDFEQFQVHLLTGTNEIPPSATLKEYMLVGICFSKH